MQHATPSALKTTTRHWLALCTLALCALSLPAQAARKALVIGNDAYTVFKPLRNAVYDARDVATELRAAGFEVPAKWVVTNGTRRQMDAAVQDFIARIGPADEVVFYYSGHGVEIDNQAALVPVDLSDPSRRPLDGSLRPLSELTQAKQQVLDESITLNRVAADIAGKDVKFSLLIVDACRDNPVLELLKAAHAANPVKSAAGPAPMAGLIVDSNADSQVLLFSASKGQQSLDRLNDADPVKNGVFTRVLLKAIRTPGLGLRDILPKIKTEVKAMAATVKFNGQPHQQQPRSMAAFDAPDFYFRPASPQFVPVPSSITAGVQVASIRPEPVEQQVQAPAPVQQTQPVRPPEGKAGQTFKDCADCPEMVVIPAGSFQMGSNDGNADEKPVHHVNLKSFAIGKYEVTQGQWQAVMGSNPSRFKDCGTTCPVENVSRDDIQQYIQKLNAKTGQQYRLPSEAEWEYAARAGSTGQWSFGNDEDQLGQHAWYKGAWYKGSSGDSGDKTHPAGQKQPNAFGVYDMHGNVREWVQDCWNNTYNSAPGDGSAWSSGVCGLGGLRGGSWNSYPRFTRAAFRSGNHHTSDRFDDVGFRLARIAP